MTPYAQQKLVKQSQKLINAYVGMEFARQDFETILDDESSSRFERIKAGTRPALRLTTAAPVMYRSMSAINEATGGVPQIDFLDVAQFTVDMYGGSTVDAHRLK